MSWATPAVKRAAVAGVATACLLAGQPAGEGATADNPVEEARRATEKASLRGTMQVRWIDSRGVHEERITVEAANGAFAVHGANDVMAAPGSQRLVHHRGKGWDLLWAPRVTAARRPDPSAKYQTAVVAGPVVAGRPTNLIEVRHGRTVYERLYVDAATGVLLRRAQYDETGSQPVRLVTFEELTLEAPVAALRVPRDAVDRAPRPVAAATLSRYDAPAALADGYQRIGVYRRGGMIQVAYSDGIYDLSLFAQPGRLSFADLPSGGTRIKVRGAPGWRYTWPGGHIVVWEGRRGVYAAVSDAPIAQVLKAVESLPAGGSDDPSLMTKLRRVCRALVQPLSA